MKERFWIVAIDETHAWDESILRDNHIEVAYCLYMIREGEGTHCCSMSVDSWAVAISNEFIFDFELDPSIRAKLIDENPEAIRSRVYDSGMNQEALEDCYFNYIDPKKYDPRFLSGPVTFEFKARDYKGGSKGDEYHRAVWDTARDYFSGNAHEPAILYPETFLAYEGENRAKRRAENKVPLPQSGDQLPLFVAAANRIPEAEVIAAGWVSPWIADWYSRHPEDLAKADARKGLR